MNADRLEILEAIEKAVSTESGKRSLPCSAAFEIASRMGISAARLGAICDEEEIRISRCQLGCFG